MMEKERNITHTHIYKSTIQKSVLDNHNKRKTEQNRCLSLSVNLTLDKKSNLSFFENLHQYHETITTITRRKGEYFSLN